MNYLFANWKMYLGLEDSIELAKKYLDLDLDNIKMAVFPSALSLTTVKEGLQGSEVSIGAQNIYWVERGGYTGEVSAFMYKDVGAEFALIGHSERRHQFKETNEDVRQKMEATIKADLAPVLCVGETKVERDTEMTDKVVQEQILSALEGLQFDGSLIIAYEPVWAIGTGDNCSAVSAEHLAEKIKLWVKDAGLETEPVVLYGGSVRPENVAEYLKQPNISGVLVGGASTKFDEWQGIINNAKSL